MARPPWEPPFLADKEKKVVWNFLYLRKPGGIITAKPEVFQISVLSVFMVSFFHAKGMTKSIVTVIY